MSRISTTAGKTTKVTESQLSGISNYGITELMKSNPLPQGRPIATNASTGIAALLGYLD